MAGKKNWTVEQAKQGLKNEEMALAHLCRARDLLVKSDNKQTVKRVRHAISSAKGAVRIGSYRLRGARTRAEDAALAALANRIDPINPPLMHKGDPFDYPKIANRMAHCYGDDK